MPKRKHSTDNYDHLSKKIKKLERKLKRARKRRTSSTASRSQSRETTPSFLQEMSDQENTEASHSNVSENMEASDILSTADNVPPPIEPVAGPSSAPVTAAPTVSTSQAAAEVPSAAANTANSDVVAPPIEEELDSEMLEILGEDPTAIPEYGKEIHKEVANRLQHIAVSGLEKEVRKELISKYLVPSNCTRIAAPLLNPEIKAAIPETSLKRDKGMELRQKQVSSAIACLGQIITTQMQAKNKDNELLKQVMDTARILCDIQHSDSMRRRYFAFSSLKKDINDHLLQNKVDKYLFGENLADTLKAAKAVSRSGADIKLPSTNTSKNVKKPAQTQPSPSKNLNGKAPPPTRRQSGPQRSRPPAPPRKRETSSRTSRQHSRQTRRY